MEKIKGSPQELSLVPLQGAPKERELEDGSKCLSYEYLNAVVSIDEKVLLLKW